MEKKKKERKSMTSAEQVRSIQGQGKEMEEPHETMGMPGLGKDSLHPIFKVKKFKIEN